MLYDYRESKKIFNIVYKKSNTILFVINNKFFGYILYRQIAGALARRIVNYAIEGSEIIQGEDSGFIKFGSRLDNFLPLKTKLNVSINQMVTGGVSKIV